MIALKVLYCKTNDAEKLLRCITQCNAHTRGQQISILQRDTSCTQLTMTVTYKRQFAIKCVPIQTEQLEDGVAAQATLLQLITHLSYVRHTIHSLQYATLKLNVINSLKC